jgi:hypothetical protein
MARLKGAACRHQKGPDRERIVAESKEQQRIAQESYMKIDAVHDDDSELKTRLLSRMKEILKESNAEVSCSIRNLTFC